MSVFTKTFGAQTFRLDLLSRETVSYTCPCSMTTVKILKIGTPEIITVIVLQLEQLDFTVQYCVQKMIIIIIIITSLIIEDYILSTCKYLSNIWSS